MNQINNNGMKILAIVCVFCVLAAIGGCCFAVIQSGAVESKDKEIAELKSKVRSEQVETGKMVTDCISGDEVYLHLSGDDALYMLRDSAADLNLDFTIANANVVGINEEKGSYWVTYTQVDNQGSLSKVNIIFEGDGEGHWSFSLPGFTGYTDETTKGYKFKTDL